MEAEGGIEEKRLYGWMQVWYVGAGVGMGTWELGGLGWRGLGHHEVDSCVCFYVCVWFAIAFGVLECGVLCV